MDLYYIVGPPQACFSQKTKVERKYVIKTRYFDCTLSIFLRGVFHAYVLALKHFDKLAVELAYN